MTTQTMTLGDILWKLDGVADSPVLAEASRAAAREAAYILREFSRTLLGETDQPASALTGKLNTYAESLFSTDQIRSALCISIAERDAVLELASNTIPAESECPKDELFRSHYALLRTNKPVYWHPQYFKANEKVMYGEFEATVEGHYAEGMWNIRTPGGSACVCGASLKRAYI
jgi:hypothetical protein